MKEDVIVIGAGAGGMMAAGRAAEGRARVLLLEKTDGPGKKILISGKTRCNLTNTKDLRDFITMYGKNGPFLRSAFHRFFRDDLLDFFRRYGVDTEVERGGRIFPASQDAADVVDALRRHLAERGARMQTCTRAAALEISEGELQGVRTDAGLFRAGAVVLAAGGATYPGTGSSGDGYRMAATAGHTIIKLRPALAPLVVDDLPLAQSMQGTSLRNVRLTSFRCTASQIETSWLPGPREKNVKRGPLIESRMGEMMITHFGIGGPITLQMSLSVVDALDHGPVSVAIDLKPALDWEQLNLRLQRDLDRWGKRSFRRILDGLLPRGMVDPFAARAAIPPDKPAHQITSEERQRTVRLLKMFTFNIKRSLPMSRAMVTAGGVDLREIDPRTMASRIVKGLFFCGEVMDINADTGGFNLQAAFSTGFLAGEEAAKYAMSR